MWEYFHAFLPAKIQSPDGPKSFDSAIAGGPNKLVAEHNSYTTKLGELGWELVSSSPVSLIDGITAGIYLIFKRPKQ
ncbi:hypothetical protein [Candidatus Chlorohelix sp.]|uniref:hypothetical protein n=1 Tax=Candidatus Chlorohelix sp. TaxID=3139201 RepID=UPI0030592413